jgi:pilus assembly protein Flp/PilA
MLDQPRNAIVSETTRTSRSTQDHAPVPDEASNQTGQGLVEYALLLVFVALLVLGILAVLGNQIGNTFSRITNALAGT